MLFDQRRNDSTQGKHAPIGAFPNYYEKSAPGIQEKPFHEIIIQIGKKDDMSALSENAELSKTLNEYYQGFQARNPNLYVSPQDCTLDEATPHLHDDFVPFHHRQQARIQIPRVSQARHSLRKVLKGSTRSDTEWNQWVRFRKADRR